MATGSIYFFDAFVTSASEFFCRLIAPKKWALFLSCQKGQTSDVRYPHPHKLTIVPLLLLTKFLATVILSISKLVLGMVMRMSVHVCAVLQNRRVRACSMLCGSAERCAACYVYVSRSMYVKHQGPA